MHRWGDSVLRKNDEITVTVKSCTALGSGVASFEGMTVFVRGAAAGDRLLVHIIKVKKTYAVGIIKKILQRSPDRIAPECPVSDRCGGCSFAHISYGAELEIKQTQVAENFRRIAKLDVETDPIIPSPSHSRYRNKAQYPVRSDDGIPVTGFYAPMTHRIVECRDCMLHPESFGRISAVFMDWMTDNGISAYDEKDHSGLVRHLYIRKGFASGELMVCVVATDDRLPRSDALVEALTGEFPSIGSIILNINREDTNVVLGSEYKLLYGRAFIRDTLCGLDFEISPQSFYQINHAAAEILYSRAEALADLRGEDTLLDLYCGTGTIGLTMAKKVKRLIGVEIVERAVDNAKRNAELNGINNAEFICADAAQAARRLRSEGIKPDVIILDPPRKGCSPELPGIIADMSPDRIVYVSCDSATLARDCAAFDSLGYGVRRVTPVDLFPRTGNVETVALLHRKDTNETTAVTRNGGKSIE
ncbi:MAG: 23S rRNA (uracil(1939)-C(5))-methyltransferase RlmD [Clostridia bacterium]|nr:23S rRNA (uracil(1939)-C(5))-methyltransferase RlmD [Clostridia bacterium]